MGVAPAIWAEQRGNPQFAALGVHQHASANQPGGNMEGKEARFGIVDSALWATVTTDTSCGAVNAMHDSFTPLGGLVPLRQHPDRRGHFRRRRLGALRDAGVGGAGGVHRRPDGRADAGVSGQEDRRPRDEARDALHPDLSRGYPAARRDRGRDQGGTGGHHQSRPARLLADSLRLHRRPRPTTARPSPA